MSIDTLRADRLGCYGNPGGITPHLDRLAAESALFETAITQAPSTTSSHASLFTSTLPSEHGASRPRGTPIAPSLRTLAEELRDAGWRTASWNGGGQVDASFGFSRGFESYESVARLMKLRERVGPALDYLDGHAGERAFLFLHSYEVHAPYTPEPALMAELEEGCASTLPDDVSFAVIHGLTARGMPIPEVDQRHVVHAYDAEIRSVDAAVGALVAGLRERGLLDRTILVVTSDHGDSLGEHLPVGEHTTNLYDEAVRVPLLIRFPGGAFAGTRVASQVRSIDVMPTILQALGRPVPPQVRGRSLLSLLTGNETADRVAIVQVDVPAASPPVAIRTRKAKLMLSAGDERDTAAPRWFTGETTVDFEGSVLTLQLASKAPSTAISLTIGDTVHEYRLTPFAQRVIAYARGGGPQRAVLRVLPPCAPAREDEPPPDCAKVLVGRLDGYHRLDTDPAERHDLRFAPEAQPEIAALRAALHAELADARGVVPGKPVALDPSTIEQLRALGYVR